MTDKQATGIANRYYDYVQKIINQFIHKEKDKYPVAYNSDFLALISYVTGFTEQRLKPLLSEEEYKVFTSAMTVIADIVVNGSNNSGRNSSKLCRLTKLIPSKRYFELLRSLPREDSFGGQYKELFTHVFATFYFPNGICIGTDISGEPIVQPYNGKQFYKNMSMFSSGVSHLITTRKIKRLKEAGITSDMAADLAQFSVVSQAASFGSLQNIEVSRVEIPYWYASLEKIFQEHMTDGKADSKYRAELDWLLCALFDFEADYLLRRNQLFQKRIVHINFEGTILGRKVVLDKFFLHEVHKDNIHQIGYEFEKEGFLVTGHFDLHDAFSPFGFPPLAETAVIAWWLRNEIDKHAKNINSILNKSGASAWFENADAWFDYCSSNKSVRAEAKRRSVSNKIIHIDSFLRRLPIGMQASAEAISLAEKYHIQLLPGYTMVKDFNRRYGGAEL